MEFAEEIIGDLSSVLHQGTSPVAYDGFEPSGRMHIAQGLMRAHTVNQLTRAGCKFKFWVADWFALMNKKLGGDLAKIRLAGELMIEIWKSAGMDLSAVEFIWSSEEIVKRSSEYWSLFLEISSHFNLTRFKKCTRALGREESDELALSQLNYVAMQCTDIFFLNVDICSLGLDQRKVNVLALEFATATKRKKPVILSHHMLLGLDGTKMSKSNSENAIFMDDSESDVNRKIKKAFCEEGNIEVNPCLEYITWIIFPLLGKLEVPRPAKWGGPFTLTSLEEVRTAFSEKRLSAPDLKLATAHALNTLLEPTRKYFKEHPEARSLQAKVKSFIS